MTTPADADSDLRSPAGAPPLPTEPDLDPIDPRTVLQERLRTVLRGLPAYFEFNNVISGIIATDLFSLNTLLGASIEGQVVKALNKQRALWDPFDDWLGYVFERQSQAFPDVRLVRKGAVDQVDIALGIELKGWFLLSKEGEPSFRFTQTSAACADHDLLVVVPWHLDNVLSGSAVAAEPYVVSARWAADYRNYYWQHMRATKADTGIVSPRQAAPYPRKDDHISDAAVYDGGGNFGRVARVKGLMTEWTAATNALEVLGIRIGDWAAFLRLHRDAADPDIVSREFARRVHSDIGSRSEQTAAQIRDLVLQIHALLAE